MTARFVCLGFLISLTGANFMNAAVTHVATNRYDIEPISGFVTEAGWTHIAQNTAYTTTTAGFDTANSFFYPAADRGSSTQPPTSVTRDLVIGNGQVSTVPTVIFRDIVPAGVAHVSLTIYRADPLDGYTPNYTTRLLLSGGSEVTIHTGSASFGNYFAPITYATYLPFSASARTLDFRFYQNATPTGSFVRLNGIEAIYSVPEPTGLAAGAVLLTGLACRRRRA